MFRKVGNYINIPLSQNLDLTECCAQFIDRLCGVALRLPGCKLRGPGFDSRRCQIFWVEMGLELGPLSPCEDEWGATWMKSIGSGLENWD
jgi:hypothetical protein